MARQKDELARPAEVAEYLLTTEKALTAMRHRGTGPPFVKVGTRVLYRWTDVDEYLKAQT